MTNNKPTLYPCRVCGKFPEINTFPVQDLWKLRPPHMQVIVTCGNHVKLCEQLGFGASDNEMVEATRLAMKHWNLINDKESE